ncbi:MAG: hypothetical protein WB778_08455 [Thermoplasmata archaeon]
MIHPILMNDLVLVLEIAGIFGGILAVVIAVLPQLLEWYFDWSNQPLKVKVFGVYSNVNPSAVGRIEMRVYNRLRSAVHVEIWPLDAVEDILADGVRSKLFERPKVRTFPIDGEGDFFLLPGHDSKQVVIEYPVRPGVKHGSEVVRPVVISHRFKIKKVTSGPFEFRVDPSFQSIGFPKMVLVEPKRPG